MLYALTTLVVQMYYYMNQLKIITTDINEQQITELLKFIELTNNYTSSRRWIKSGGLSLGELSKSLNSVSHRITSSAARIQVLNKYLLSGNFIIR